MNIRLTSSLNPEDENVIALAVLKAMAAILDLFPVAYALRIDTSDGATFHQAGTNQGLLTSRAGTDISSPSPVGPREA